MELGARCEIPAEFLRASIHADGCVVEYEQNGNLCSVDSSLIINCAGPWATSIAARIDPPRALPEVDLVQGSHLLLPPLLKHHFYVEAPQDKRAVFLLPWQGKLMLGTTEKIHTGAPESSHCSLQEQTYLLDVLHHYFPHLAVGEAQVESFAGLRVLPRSDASAFSRPREVMFAVDNEQAPRVLSVMGGKLTTYRATAERVLNRLAPSLPLRKPKADTRKLRLIPVDWPF
jgi:glycerol-3-phosphate dehydrogenase